MISTKGVLDVHICCHRIHDFTPVWHTKSLNFNMRDFLMFCILQMHDLNTLMKID